MALIACLIIVSVGAAGVLLVQLCAGDLAKQEIWGTWLGLALSVVALLVFAWVLIEGLALVRIEDARLRELRAEAARAAERVEQARRRARGQH